MAVTPMRDLFYRLWVIWLCGWCSAVCMSHALAQDRVERAGDKFENVTVLRDMPAQQMGKVMNIMSEALGVSCTHCHAGYDFAREGVPHKDTSRRMIEMTLKLNRESFAGKTVVTCMTCHQGKPTVPSATISATLSGTLSTVLSSSPSAPAAQLPAMNSASKNGESKFETNSIEPTKATDTVEAVEAVIRRYRQLSGNRHAPDHRVESAGKARRFPGKRLEPSGKEEVEVIQLTSPTTWEQITTYGQLDIIERYADGRVEKKAGEKSIELKPEEAAQIRIEARLALGLELRSQLADWQVEGSEPAVTLDGRPMQLLRARESEMTHHFLLDPQTGLIRRRTTTVPTVLGGYVIQVDYENYREIDGRPVAELTSFRMPSVRWQRRLSLPQSATGD